MATADNGTPAPRHLYEGETRPESKQQTLSIPIARPSPQNNQQVRCTVLSRKIYGAMTHYVGSTVRCLSSQGHCIWCQTGKPRRWIGYLAAFDQIKRQICLLELTHKAAEDLERQAENYPTLRGLWIQLGRKKNRPNGEVEIQHIEPVKLAPNQTMPEEFSVGEQLDRIWKTYGKDTRADDLPIIPSE